MSNDNLILAELYKDGYTSIPNYYFDSILPLLTPAESRVLQIIFRHAQHESLNSEFIVKMSLNELSKYTGLTKKTIVTNLEKLLQKQYIFRIKHVVSNNEHQTNKYILNTEKLFGVQDE